MSDNEDTTFFKLSRRRKKKRLKKMNRASVKCGTILKSNTHAIGVSEKARKSFEEI